MSINQTIRAFVAILFIAISFGCSKGADPLDVANAKPVDQALVASNPALAMVERFNMGSNLEHMAIQVSKKTHTYAMVAEKHGTSNAQSVITEEIQKILPVYQVRWNQNLANAYSSHLTPDELRSLAVDGKQSPYANKLQAEQKSVGEDMQKISSPILTELVTKALTNAIN
ncbi:MAG: hypothetical protein AABY68_04480 [Pseudomonadota bacterium]